MIAGPFRYRSARTVRVLDPQGPRSALGPALNLVGAAVAAAQVFRDGDLTVSFADDRSLEVSPLERFEAWQVTGPGFLAVCRPGGEPSVWLSV